MTELRVWDTTLCDTVFMEWRDRGVLWSGRDVRNAGMTVLEFDDAAVRRVRTFTNTAYLQAVESGWEKLLTVGTLLALPAFHTLDLPDAGWRPYPPSPRVTCDIDPPRRLEEALSLADRVARHYDPTRSAHDRAAAGDDFERPPGAFWEFQGTRWPLAGRNVIESTESFRALFTDVFGPIFRGTLRFTHIMTWQATDAPWAFMEWVSTSTPYTGRPMRNHGITALRFDDAGRNLEHREYTNVAYLEAIFGDWRPLVPPQAFDRLACASTYETPADAWTPLPLKPAAGAVGR